MDEDAASKLSRAVVDEDTVGYTDNTDEAVREANEMLNAA